jgi:transcriptional regulator with XRE-family HTH domain
MGLSGFAMATLIGVKYSAYYSWETGRSTPTGENVAKLECWSGETVEALMKPAILDDGRVIVAE